MYYNHCIMKKLLPILKNVTTKSRWLLSAVVVIVMLLGITQTTHAQVYYLVTSGKGNVSDAANAVKKIDYTGSNDVNVTTGFPNPALFELDLTNNRAFVYNGFLGSRVINVINMSSGAVTNTIALPSGIQVSGASVTAIKYDAINNWVYYITSIGTGVANDLNALYRSKPDGTQNAVVKTQIALLPNWLALDIPNNRVFINEAIFSARKMLTLDLGTNTVTANPSISNIVNAISYDPVTDYIYYITSDNDQLNTGTTNGTTNDALRKIHPDGTGGEVVVKSSVVISPQYMALDAGNNRAFVYNGYYGSSNTIRLTTTGIYVVDLTTGATTLKLDHSGLQNTPNYLRVMGLFAPARPIVNTTAVTTFSSASATLGGNVSNSDASVTERGVIYSSSNNAPTIGGSGVTKASNGTGTGAFSASISGLSASTTYYVRSYATSGAGTSYGTVTSFATQSNDANLSAFTISSGTLNPTFAAATTTYTASVTNATTSITVTPTRNQANATIKVNTTTVASGTASGNLALNIGDNTINTVVTAQDGTTTKTYTLTVNRPKAAQTVTFASTASKTFGNPDFAAGGSASSGLTVSYTSSNTGVATVSGSTIHIVGAGSTTITASQAGDANYLAATSVTQTLTVDKASQTITFNALTARTYGNSDFSPGATATSGATVTYASDNAAVATIVSNQVHIVGQGTATITASQTGNTNYNAAANVTQSLTVNKATVTVTAAAKTKVYGDADPAFTYTATGVVGSDAPTGALSRALPTTTNRFVGTYTIDQNTISYGSNYNITYVSANLTITKRPLTIAPLPVTKQYGDADFAQGAPYSFNGTSIDAQDGMSGPFSRTPNSENAGTYALTIGVKHPVDASTGEDRSANYNITFITNTFTITAKPVTVTANAQTKTYGDADPALTYTADALVSGDSFSGALTRAAGESFGTYAISKGTLALSSNYTLTFNGSNLTIGKKTVNVAAAPQTKNFGDTDPALTYTNDALAFGESFTGALTRAAGENFGTYAISQGNLALNSNYTLNFTGANLTINKKTINVTAIAKTKTYGDSDPTLNYNADLLVGGDSFTGAITRAPGETFGTYAISQGTLALGSNYTLNYTGANLSIGKRAIDIYSGSRDVPYGDPDGTIGYSYSGTPVSGDTFSGALGREPGTALGTYATTIGTFGITNGGSYDLIFHSGTFNIVQREIIVSGGSTFKIYGDADPAINYSIYSGSLLPGTQITGALSRDAGETAGPYNVNQGTLAISDANYKLTFQGGYFEIDRAPLTFTIDNKTKVATKPNPALTYSVTGYKNGDTQATAFTTPINLTTDASISSAAGDYNIYPSGGVTAPNYDITTVGGTLTVTPASTINTLASATLNGGGFNEPFDAATDFYSVNIPNGSTSATLTASVTDPLSTMSIGAYPEIATPVASGTPYTISFSNNNTEQVGVHVTAENGSIKSYYFNVSPIPSDSKLSNLGSSVGVISPSFNPLVTSYTLDVSAETDSITITPTTHDPAATARVSGGGEGGSTGAKKIALLEGGNPVNINVRSADHTGNTFYQLYIKRPIRLKTLTLSAGNLFPAFDPNVTSYVAKVGESIPAITVTPEGNQSYFQITVNGDQVTSGDASAPVTINADGSTTIAVKITAGDGETSKTYNISVVHASSDAALAGISLSTGTLDPVFDPATFTYNVYLPNSTTMFAFTPATTEAHAAVYVNNAPLAAGETIANNNVAAGMQNYYIAVTAADGVTTKTYTLSVHRAYSHEAGLSNILLNHGTLSPAFDQATYNSYDVAVRNEVSSIDVTPVLADTTASISARLNGHNITLPAGVITAPLAIGVNSLIITSAAQDGTTMAITSVIITRAAADASLSNLTLSAGTLSPGFDKNTGSYTASVANTVNTITITPTITDALSTVKVNGITSTSGEVSSPVNLSVGANAIAVDVTAGDGVTTQTYTLNINRAPSSESKLANITLSSGTLSPAFSPALNSYTATVVSPVNTIVLSPETVQADATVSATLNGSPVALVSGAFTLPLNVGSNAVSITSTAQDGTTLSTYTLAVTRIVSSNAYLSDMRLNPLSALTRLPGAGNNFTATVASSVTTVALMPTAAGYGAQIKVNNVAVASGTYSGAITLNASGPTVISMEVTAEDGIARQIYSITVTRTGSSNAYLSEIRLDPPTVLTRVAGAGNNFTATVASSVTTVSLMPIAADAGAQIKLNNTVIASGTYSGAITLNASGPTVIGMEVTAENGVDKQIYSITVTRTGSSNAYLSEIRLNPSTVLTRVAGTGNNFTATVASSATTVTVMPTAADAGAHIKVNNVAVTSGTYSGAITLNASGPTVIGIEVTAENGVSTQIYSITVTRAGSSNAYLSDIRMNPLSALTRTPGGGNNFTATVASSATTVTVMPTAADAGAHIKVNNVAVASGTYSGAITLNASGPTVIGMEVTAENGVSTQIYSITVTRSGSSNAYLSDIRLDPSTAVVRVPGAGNNFTATVSSSATTVSVMPTAADAGAHIKVNNIAVASGTYSGTITLNASGPTIFGMVVTAENGISTQTYSITVNRAAPPVIAAVNKNRNTIEVLQKPEPSTDPQAIDLVVKQAVSPNGDGINDRLTIQGINAFPENTVRIMNRNGDVVYEARGYDNESKAFDGHSSKGTLQQAGTYFYSVEYKKGTETKRKTGYIVVKY
jgi:gliding motility-associated-like protein